jgi:gamma-glutamyltranspeptidase/glutathione hydrolase
MIDFDLNPQLAGDAARIRHEGSASPTGEPAASNGGTVVVEPQVPAEVVEALRKRGHQVERGRGGGFGGYQGILIDWEHGTLFGATEPRKDGCAVGY